MLALAVVSEIPLSWSAPHTIPAVGEQTQQGSGCAPHIPKGRAFCHSAMRGHIFFQAQRALSKALNTAQTPGTTQLTAARLWWMH